MARVPVGESDLAPWRGSLRANRTWHHGAEAVRSMCDDGKPEANYALLKCEENVKLKKFNFS